MQVAVPTYFDPSCTSTDRRTYKQGELALELFITRAKHESNGRFESTCLSGNDVPRECRHPDIHHRVPRRFHLPGC